MKNHPTRAIAVFFAIFLNVAFLQAQDVAGQWNGVLNIQGMKMRIVFNIGKTDDGYSSTMDSPDQSAFGIPVASTAFDGAKLSISMPNLGLTYEGEFKTDSITWIRKI